MEKNVFCNLNRRLNQFNEAEMRRSRLVERATTDEDDELDSWGSDDDDEDEKAEVVDQSEVKEETKSLRNEDIGPDGSPENESQKEPEQPVDTKGKIFTF